jgi:hypothetical protein
VTVITSAYLRGLCSASEHVIKNNATFAAPALSLLIMLQEHIRHDDLKASNVLRKTCRMYHGGLLAQSLLTVMLLRSM